MISHNVDSALGSLPPIRRARLWRLYAQDGRRFLDLWQDGGRGILGARHAGLGNAIKAALDRGLDRPLPSVLEPRLGKLLLERFPPAKAVRLYVSEEAALAALARASGIRAGSDDIACGIADSSLVRDPTRRKGAEKNAPALLLRPFASFISEKDTISGSWTGETRFALPLLPLARGLAPAALLFADAAGAEAAGPGDLVPPLFLRAAIDALFAQDRYLASVGEAHWRRADRRLKGLFERRGPWLLPLVAAADYPRLFEVALSKGILLSPDFARPSLLPGDFDDGELAPLAALSP